MAIFVVWWQKHLGGRVAKYFWEMAGKNLFSHPTANFLGHPTLQKFYHPTLKMFLPLYPWKLFATPPQNILPNHPSKYFAIPYPKMFLKSAKNPSK